MSATFKATLVLTKDGDEFFSAHWPNVGDTLADAVDFQEAVANALFALARKRIAEKSA